MVCFLQSTSLVTNSHIFPLKDMYEFLGVPYGEFTFTRVPFL